MELFGTTGIAIIILVIAMLAVFGLIARRYIKVAPNEVLVIAGRKHTIVDPDGKKRIVGHRTVKGGGTFVIPVLEKVSRLSLNVIPIDVSTEDAYTRDGVPVIVDSVIVMKIGGDDISIANASERFLGFSVEQVKGVAKEVLGGHLRAICSTLIPEEINKDRLMFQQKVLEVAHRDFTNMGLAIDSFTVRQIRDKQGYFEALGKKSTAEVKRNAIIGEAEALARDAVKKESEAKQEGQVRKAETEAEIAEANKERDVKMAKYSAETSAEKARAEQAGPKAQATAKQDVIEAETQLAIKEAARKEKELLATVIKPAEANREAAIVAADGDKQSRIRRAEAQKIEFEREGEGQAAKTRALGEAEGAALKAKGEGEAAGIMAKLLAEAQGLQKKAEAMKEFTDSTMELQTRLELIKTLPAIVEKVVAPMSSVKNLELYDFGGNRDGQGGPINNLLNISPQALASTNQILKSVIGKDLNELVTFVRSGQNEVPVPPGKPK